MPKAGVFVVIAMAVLLTSCLSTLFGTKDSKSRDFDISEPGEGWEIIDPGEADNAYRNNLDQAILNISSACGEGRFQTLEKLASVILKQLPSHEVLEPARTATIGGYPGLITEVRGTIDGQPLFVRLAVVRTSSCLFDIILAGNKLTPSSRLAFDKALKGFRASSQP